MKKISLQFAFWEIIAGLGRARRRHVSNKILRRSLFDLRRTAEQSLGEESPAAPDDSSASNGLEDASGPVRFAASA